MCAVTQSLDNRLQVVGKIAVIVVEVTDELSPGFRQRGVPGRSLTARPAKFDTANPPLRIASFQQGLDALATVVDDDQFPRAETLRDDRIDRAPQQVQPVAGGHDDTDDGFFRGSRNLRTACVRCGFARQFAIERNQVARTRRGHFSPLRWPVALAGCYGFPDALASMPMFDTVGRSQVQPQHLRNMQEGLLAHQTQPEIIIPRHFHVGVEIAVALVQRLAPHGVRPDITHGKQKARIEIRPTQAGIHRCVGKIGVLLPGNGRIGVDQRDIGPGLEFTNHAFEGVGAVPVIGVGIGKVLAARHSRGAVPGGIDRLSPVGADIANIRVALLKLLDDGTFSLRRSAVYHDDLQALRQGLGHEVFQAAANILLAVVGRNDGCDQVIRFFFPWPAAQLRVIGETTRARGSNGHAHLEYGNRGNRHIAGLGKARNLRVQNLFRFLAVQLQCTRGFLVTVLSEATRANAQCVQGRMAEKARPQLQVPRHFHPGSQPPAGLVPQAAPPEAAFLLDIAGRIVLLVQVVLLTEYRSGIAHPSDMPVLVHNVRRAHHPFDVGPLDEHTGDDIQAVGMELVVRVDPGHDFPGAAPEALVDRGILPVVGVAPPPGNIIRVPFDDLDRAVVAATIDNDQFQVGVALVDDGTQGYLQEAPLVIGRNDHADTRSAVRIFPPGKIDITDRFVPVVVDHRRGTVMLTGLIARFRWRLDSRTQFTDHLVIRVPRQVAPPDSQRLRRLVDGGQNLHAIDHHIAIERIDFERFEQVADGLIHVSALPVEHHQVVARVDIAAVLFACLPEQTLRPLQVAIGKRLFALRIQRSRIHRRRRSDGKSIDPTRLQRITQFGKHPHSHAFRVTTGVVHQAEAFQCRHPLVPVIVDRRLVAMHAQGITEIPFRRRNIAVIQHRPVGRKAQIVANSLDFGPTVSDQIFITCHMNPVAKLTNGPRQQARPLQKIAAVLALLEARGIAAEPGIQHGSQYREGVAQKHDELRPGEGADQLRKYAKIARCLVQEA